MAIVALHVLLVYCLATGLSRTSLAIQLPPTNASFFKDPPKTVSPPPPPAPTLVEPVVDLGPLPDIPQETDGDSGTKLTAMAQPLTRDPQPPAPVEPLRLLGRNQLPNTEDYYPPSLRRHGSEGATNVRVCVDENGSQGS